MRKPGPILTKIDAKLTQDWVKTWIRNPARGEADDLDAADLVQLEQQRAGRRGPQRGRDQRDRRISVREQRTARVRGEVARRAATRRRASRSSSRSAASAATSSAKAIAQRVGPRRTFGQPLENIGNKTTYEWLYNWVRDPKHYSPATVHAQPAPHRRAGGRRGDVPDDAEGAGGRRRRRRRRPRRPQTPCCSTISKSVMPLDDAQGATGEDGPAGRSSSSSASASSAGTAASAATTSRASRRRSRSAPTCRKRAASWSRGSTSRSSPTSRTRRSSAGSDRSCTTRASFDQGRVLQPLEQAAHAELRLQRRRESSGCVTAIMSFQRDMQPPAALPARTARRDYTVRGRTLVHRRNCVGCHMIEGDGGDFLKLVADPSLGPPRADAGGREGAARLAVRVPSGADHDSSVAGRPDADVRPGRSEPERRHPVLRGDLEHRSGRSRRTTGRAVASTGGGRARSCSSC